MTAYAWSKHWPAEATLAFGGGILSLAGFCLQRSMSAPDWTPQALVVLGQALWILAPAWPRILARVQRNRTFAWIGIFARGPLLLMAFATITPLAGGQPDQGVGPWWLLFAGLLIAVNLDAVYTPHRNAMIRANYALTARGRIFGMIQLVSMVASVAGAMAAGRVLDLDPRWARVVFPVGATIAIVGYALMARIRWRYDGPVEVPAQRGLVLVWQSMREAVAASVKTLKQDPDFRRFELGFMLYGIGLLAATPLFVTHFAKVFTTEQWATADRLVLPLTQLVLIGLVGRLSDRIGIVKVAGLSFGLLVPFFLLMAAVATPWQLCAANVLFGACMAGVNVSWSLGPLYFAPRGQAHHYSAVHMACVGVRSVLGPVLGYAMFLAVSFEAALAMAAAFEVAAAAVTFRLARRVHLTT